MNGSNRSTVTEAVIKLVTENPMVKIDHIEAPMLLAELNVDSLEKLSIAMDLEEAFDLEITDQEVEDFVTVSDIISCVDQALAAKAAQALADEAEEDESSAALDTGQPDSNASAGSTTNGLWMVDTSIGTFGADCLTDVCGSSFVGFRIDEELANFGAKTVVGRTPGVSGSMELVGTQVIGAEFVVDMTGLITDNDSRTGALRGPNGGIETDAFPEARFELTQSIELGSVPAEGASIDVWATGNRSLHGVTNEVVIPLTAEVQAGVIIVFGNLEGILLADYGIPKPTAVVVVSVEDNATLELQLFFSR